MHYLSSISRHLLLINNRHIRAVFSGAMRFSRIGVCARMCMRLWSIFSVVRPSSMTNANVIVASPISVTVCAGENAEFYCTTVNGAPLRWSVDGMDAGTNAVNARNISFVTRTYYQSPSSNGYTSTLTVYGSIANSNSSIQCFARYNNVIFETDVAVLLVQGSTGASLMAEAMVLNSTHVVLTWSPPGDAIDPVLLNYIVVVRNGSATLAQLATPVNETRAIVSSSLLSTCDTYLIIQPICSTTAGRGDTVRWYTIDAMTELSDDATKVTILGTAVSTIKYYSVVFVNSRNSWNLTVESFSDSVSFTASLSVGHNEKLFANVTIYDYKSCRNGRLIAITTFDVTRVRLLGPTPRIQCSFNLGSTAKGCLALFDDGKSSYCFFVRRNSTSDEATSDALQGVAPGNYTLLIYDVEATGTPSSSPALSGNVTIVGQDFTTANETDKKEKGDVMVSTKDGSICIDCGLNGCLALIRTLNGSTELHAYPINASRCFGIARSTWNGNYSVAVFILGSDGVILNGPIVNQQISLYSNAERPNGNFMVGVSSQCIYIGSTLSAFCILLLALFIGTLVALVNTSRMLKMKAKNESNRGIIEMNENEAYSSVLPTSAMRSASTQ